MSTPPPADLSGRTCLVTGANTGIGKEIAKGLAYCRAHVILSCRSRERADPAAEEIKRETGNDQVEVALVDLAEQSSIRDFAADILRKHDQLHVLVNNAGVWQKERTVNADGYETTWAVNVLGYHLLTSLLLPRLRSSAPARIVNVASRMAWGLDFDDLQFDKRPWDGAAAYAQSKQADRMLTWALHDRLRGSGVTANAMHPGGVRTDLFRNHAGLLGLMIAIYIRVAGRSAARGADTAVWAASSAELAERSGEFFQDRRVKPCDFRDAAEIERLWQACEQMTAKAE